MHVSYLETSLIQKVLFPLPCRFNLGSSSLVRETQNRSAVPPRIQAFLAPGWCDAKPDQLCNADPRHGGLGKPRKQLEERLTSKTKGSS